MTFNQTIKVQSPATVANLVCGYDVLGLCLEAPYDDMEVTLIEEPKVIIRSSDAFALPADPSENTAGAPLLKMIEEQGHAFGFDVFIHKNIKPGSGIGSSAASAAGAVVAANALIGNIYNQQELVRLAMYGEEIASGVQHADNIAPCIYGGITLIRSTHPLDIIAIPAPDLWVAVVHPQIEVKTSVSRSVLPKEVPLKAAVQQWANVGGLVAGLFMNDVALIGRSLSDGIVEPARQHLIQGLGQVKQRSMACGAVGGGISGSGPSIFMLCRNETIAQSVTQQMSGVYQSLSIPYHVHVTRISKQGVRIV